MVTWSLIKTRLREDDIVVRGRHIFIYCPFHSESVPSCVVNPDLNCFHCFGCGQKGTLAKLARQLGIVTETDKLTYLIKSWEHCDKAKELIYKYRGIVYDISELYRVGYLENGKPLIYFPHPAPDDYNAYIVWDLRRYSYSSGLNKTVPFGYSLVKGKEVFVVEGVFDCMSLTQIGKPAVATLGNNSVVGVADLFSVLILAPDNDDAGRRLLRDWIGELHCLGRLASAKVCLWKSKDANDALKAGTLTKEAQRQLWLPTYLIFKVLVDTKFDLPAARQTLEPYLSDLTDKQRQRAVAEATELIKRRKPHIDLKPLLEPDEPAWVKVLKSAIHDGDLLTFLLNLPDFNIYLLPADLRRLLIKTLFGQTFSLKSPFGRNAVKWAWAKAKERSLMLWKRKINL